MPRTLNSMDTAGGISAILDVVLVNISAEDAEQLLMDLNDLIHSRFAGTDVICAVGMRNMAHEAV